MSTEQVANNGDATEEDLEAQLAYENLKRNREARKRRRAIVVACGVVALLAVVVWFIVGHASQPEESDDIDPLAATAMVYQGDFATTVQANGATEPLSSTIVTPEVDGIIENVSIEEGSTVSKGDVLFTLKNDELDKGVREAQNQLNAAERSADAANRAVDDAYAAYNKAWNAANEAGDWSDFDETGLNSAIRGAEEEYEGALEGVESAKVALQEAQAKADKRTVKAPVSGSVVAMNAVNGASTEGGGEGSRSSGAPLVQISDLSQMKVTVQVNEVDIASIEEGQAAKATFSALPGVELDATVQRIATVSTGSGESSGFEGGVVTYAVDLLIPEPDAQLKPGMTATVTITTQSVPHTLVVPTAALMDDGSGTTYVTVIADEETAQTRDVPVEVAEKNSSEAAVSGDLVEGDLVLLGGGLGDEDLAALDVAPDEMG